MVVVHLLPSPSGNGNKGNGNKGGDNKLTANKKAQELKSLRFLII